MDSERRAILRKLGKEEVAQTMLEGGGEPASHVANVCLISTTRLGEETLINFTAPPWTERRTSPSEVFAARFENDEYPFDSTHPEGLRELAVRLLAEDLEAAAAALGGEYVDGLWEVAD